MNDVLELKGSFKSAKAKAPGPVCLPAHATITSDEIREEIKSLHDVYENWLGLIPTPPIQPLISIHYKSVIAKSNRVRCILGGRHDASDAIRGAKFDESGNGLHHVITYSVSFSTIENTLDTMEQCADVIDRYFNGSIDNDKLKTVSTTTLKYQGCKLSKSSFAQAIKDMYFIKRFSVETIEDNFSEVVDVNLYDTGGKDILDFMHSLGIDIIKDQILRNTVRLYHKEFSILVKNYPYLVSMAVNDVAKMPEIKITANAIAPDWIDSPGDEPIIGIIDTLFDSSVYFSEWVEFHYELPNFISPEPEDYNHGTAVSSIIVDGPSLNPELNDECGYFRVRHFGIATSSYSSFVFIQDLERIIRDNPDIKVWNISFGSKLPIPENFISPEAAILDELQTEYDDIVFIIAGTNKTSKYDSNDIIGSPADSINSLVVNATGFDGTTASYSRRGPVLKFYKKPDICYVGGDENKRLCVCEPSGLIYTKGTSFAAPWIARKMAYLMQVMGFTREVAKALLIDAAAGWDFIDDAERGYGFVPIKISDILKTPNDEIRFILSGKTSEYETYNYDIPVPVTKDTHPYIARATMCYFPKCDRKQGVDYASTEMDLHFGRVKDNETIVSINNNCQGDPNTFTYEKQARDFYRKWDNVKHIGEELKPGLRARKAYKTGMWGLNIRLVERNNQDRHPGHGMPFGIVITLKDIEGANRIDEFIQRCSLRGWIVNRIDIENRIDIYNAAQVEIDFED